MLAIPSFVDPTRTNPLTTAVGWISMIASDFRSGNGRVVVDVNADEASATASLPAVSQISIPLGRPGGTSHGASYPGMPSLAQLVADNQAAFAQIEQYLYNALAQQPEFAGSTQVA